jgi:hypothetical protein
MYSRLVNDSIQETLLREPYVNLVKLALDIGTIDGSSQLHQAQTESPQAMVQVVQFLQDKVDKNRPIAVAGGGRGFTRYIHSGSASEIA